MHSYKGLKKKNLKRKKQLCIHLGFMKRKKINDITSAVINKVKNQ